ncbi:MAG: heme-copper oxidase subunit III [Opitutales bacterium]
MSEATAKDLSPDHDEDHHEAATNTGIPNKKLAMWAFLASDCMFFGTLISTHLIYRRVNPDVVIDDNVVPVTSIFDIELTSASTFILLMSSLTMALTVSAMHKHNVKAARWFLLSTIFFGSLFIGAQIYEFNHFVHNEAHPLTLTNTIFGSTFYLLTGTHGVHVLIGLLWLTTWYFYSFSPKFKEENAMDIEVTGLYWHFVDIVWILIFPLVYIIEYI